MRFYYFSLLSWMAYGIAVLVVVTLLSILWTKLLKFKVRNPIYWILVAAILVLPWVEEMWIAYNFDQLCGKDAGVFVNKTVEVDGFYDDTTAWGPPQLAASQYKFVESKDYVSKALWRVERVGEEIRNFRINAPTARYKYKTVDSHRPVAHQVKRFESVVIDDQTGEVIGRYTNYSRGAYWFFISLGRPSIECKETESGVRRYGTLSMYALTLTPSK